MPAWSRATMAEAVGISPSSVGRIWSEARRWDGGGFSFLTEPTPRNCEGFKHTHFLPFYIAAFNVFTYCSDLV
jgi:hypothetical protein